MTLLSLAIRNVRLRLVTYAAFFLSSVFAVWLYYSYATLLEHPGVGGVRPELLMGLRMLLILVGGFAVVFIGLAHGAFLKARQKELGLLTMLGMLPGQIARVLAVENFVIGAGAIGAGIGLGVLLSRLFFLTMGRALAVAEPLTFHFSGPAAARTVLVFGGVFAAVTTLGYLRVRLFSVADLIRAAASGDAAPRLAWWKVALCAVSLGGGYTLLFTAGTDPSELRIQSALGLLLLGTYLLFAQGSVALVQWLRRQPTLYWRSVNLITLSQMAYKVRGNAWILFMVAALITIVLVAGTTYAGSIRYLERSALTAAPVGLITGEGVDPARVEAVLQEHAARVTARGELRLVQAVLLVGPDHRYGPLWFASAAGLSGWQQELFGRQAVTVAPGQLLTEPDGRLVLEGASVTPLVGSEPGEPLRVVGGLPDLRGHNFLYRLNVVDQSLFDRLLQVPGVRVVTLRGWDLADWRASGPAMEQLERELGFAALRSPWLDLRDLRQNAALLLFMAGFLTVLFFLATGNMLYFKLLSDLYSDRLQFRALFKLGVGETEVRRIVSVQTLVLFTAPVAVAVIHSAVLLTVLGRVSDVDFRVAMWAVAGGYLLLQLAYWRVTRRVYTRALLQGE